MNDEEDDVDAREGACSMETAMFIGKLAERRGVG